MACGSAFIQVGVTSDPVIDGLLRRVTSASALDNLEYLTGVTSDIKSRNSIHPDGLKAADWIANEFTKYGFTAVKETFQVSESPEPAPACGWSLWDTLRCVVRCSSSRVRLECTVACFRFCSLRCFLRCFLRQHPATAATAA